jgi:osmotically-inducible protein OsmY
MDAHLARVTRGSGGMLEMAVADRLRAVQIKANIIADKIVGLAEIDVEVHDGIALLTGEVDTEEQKRKAEELAYDIEGVHEVENQIQLVPRSLDELLSCEGVDAHLGYGPAEGPSTDEVFPSAGAYAVPGPGLAATEQFPGEFTDDQIDEEVKRKLSHARDLDVSRVRLCSANQIVYIKGTLGTNEELNRLQDVVMNIRGVMGVRSEVEVEEGDEGTPAE